MEILTIRDVDPEDEAEEVLKVISTTPSRQIFSTMTVSGNRLVQFQIDTGATCNLILKRDLPENTAVDRGGKKTLHFYNGAKSPTLGTCQLQLKTRNGNRYWQTFQVVANGATSLIGSRAAQEMNLISVNDECRKELSCNNEVNQCSEHSISSQPMTRSEFVKRFPKVFQREIGCLPGKLHLDVVDGARPTHMPTRRFPTAIKEPLRAELDRLTRLGIIEQVDEPTEWTSALVVVHKPNGSLRICLDPHDLNPALKRNTHPVPTIDEILPDMTRAKVFTKCDVRSGFWHVQLDKESADLTTFGTPFGRFRWNRMPFGIAPASEIFQKKLEQALEGLEGIRNIHDDIVIWGEGETLQDAIVNHDRRLYKLLERCEERGIALNESDKKFILRTPTLPYMGHIFTADGLKIDQDKVKAITSMPQPDGPQGVRRFLGMANFVSRFVPNMSKLSAPLRSLTEQDNEWVWDPVHEKSFQDVKEAIARSSTLKFFNPSEHTTVQCDASSQGLGAVIMQNGQPVAFASRSLSSAEINYCQIEKELLAVVFAMHRFDQYVYGRHVSIESDHQPLQILTKKPLKDVPRRLQRMLLELQRYDFTVTYKKGELLFIADTLSRAYLPEHWPEYDADERVCQFSSEKEWEKICLTKETTGLSDERIVQIQERTREDPTLKELQIVIKTGWPSEISTVKPELKPYFHIRDELVTEDDIIYKGNRCLIPAAMRKDILTKLHSVHMGVTGTLRRARESVYWPCMNADIKNYIERCQICNENRTTSQQKETLQPHSRPTRPWAKVGVDMFSLDKRNFLITVDYWSSYFELDQIIGDTTSKKVVQCLRRHFATHGIPDTVISDNGPQFVSEEFKKFSMEWMFNHVTTSPYHSQSNGMVESSVKIAKNILRTSMTANEDPWLAILAFRNTPTEGMATSPVQRLMSRRTKTLMPMVEHRLFPDSSSQETDVLDRQRKQEKQEEYYNKTSKDLPELKAGDEVWVKPHTLGQKKWKKATVVTQRTEPRSYDIQMNTGETLRRNRIDLKKSPETNDREEQDVDKEEGRRENHPDNQRATLSNEHYVTSSGRISRPPTRYHY